MSVWTGLLQQAAGGASGDAEGDLSSPTPWDACCLVCRRCMLACLRAAEDTFGDGRPVLSTRRNCTPSHTLPSLAFVMDLACAASGQEHAQSVGAPRAGRVSPQLQQGKSAIFDQVWVSVCHQWVTCWTLARAAPPPSRVCCRCLGRSACVLSQWRRVRIQGL